MSLPAGSVSSTRATRLSSGWTLASTTPDQFTEAAELAGAPLDWRPAIVPGTVAQAIGPSDLDGHEEYDARDWWYRCSFKVAASERPTGTRVRLRFDGLATLAEAWLNGTRVLESTNMFVAAAVDVTDVVAASNELVLVFRSLTRALEQKRPRPRWKTKLVDHQQLRWHRTTLLGRIPGWTPRIQPVGPWRPVWLEVVSGPDLVRLDARPRLEGTVGVLPVDAEARAWSAGARVDAASLRVGDRDFDLTVEHEEDTTRIHGEARIPGVALWWPRTHGTPVLHACALTLATTDGPVTVDLGRVGFRDVSLDTTNGDVRFVVNGVPVFCRGACWTTNDVVSLSGPDDRLRRTLELMADAHANMVRVGGTMVYESDAFYRTCDELGLLVWQDFMCANMDYPTDDAAFRESLEAEVEQQLRRLQGHPSVVAVCGGSEIEQQAAMFGAPREVWTHEFFAETAPRLVAELLGERTPYWTSTPTGGAMPFHVGTGIAHYFGVGAYLRPLEDARTAGVRFGPECLGFSNVPEPENLRGLDASAPPHDPTWKHGVPRDSGTNWDFEDVRDHYLRLVYGVDPVELRSSDLERYLARSRAVTGRVMAHVFDEWRSPENPCAGGLVWFLQDLRPGAGWGIIDSDARPKPVYHYLKRAWAPIRVALLDRGLDGVRIEVHNETAAAVDGTLEVSMYGPGSVLTTRATKRVVVGARDSLVESLDAMVGHFTDSTYAYRFGPLAHAAIVARLRIDGRSEELSTFRWSALDTPLPASEPRATVRLHERGATTLLEASKLARDVRVDCPGWTPSEDWVDLAPGEKREIALVADRGSEP